ncbi:MAG TPA: hypothetical protein VJ553_04020 [Candidatus Paceibacterota bacterium]|nr:hypothetical protein [Candidatus Paceibacterota bacterium]
MISVRDSIIFLLGFLLGGLVVRVLVLRAARKFLRPRMLSEQYMAARQAAARHLAVHGTLNVAQLERLTEMPPAVLQEYLDRMEREGHIMLHGHRESGRFYTRR